MNRAFWHRFYETDHEQQPTEFAKFCTKFIPPGSKVLDIGCGNGRDSYYLAENGAVVKGVDFAVAPKDYMSAKFVKADLESVISEPCEYDIVYSRFFLHAITSHELDKLILWSKGLFMAEFRCYGDKPKLYVNHDRTFVHVEKLLKRLITLHYKILFFTKGYGMAKYKNEDPLIGRLIAQR